MRPAPIPPDWFRDRWALIELLDWLIDRGEVVTARDARDVIEKPHKFELQLKQMLAERALEDDGVEVA